MPLQIISLSKMKLVFLITFLLASSVSLVQSDLFRKPWIPPPPSPDAWKTCISAQDLPADQRPIIKQNYTIVETSKNVWESDVPGAGVHILAKFDQTPAYSLESHRLDGQAHFGTYIVNLTLQRSVNETLERWVWLIGGDRCRNTDLQFGPPSHVAIATLDLKAMEEAAKTV